MPLGQSTSSKPGKVARSCCPNEIGIDQLLIIETEANVGTVVRVQFTDQSISVFFRGRRKMENKGLDELAACASECFRAAEDRGIGLHEIRIEVVPANQKAELVSEPRLAVAISVGGMPLRRRGNCGSSWRA